MSAKDEVSTLREALTRLPRRRVVDARTVGGDRLVSTLPAWPDDDGRYPIHMVVGPETPVEEATAVLVALAEQVARAVVVSFDRTPFGLKDGLRSVPGVAPRDAKAVVGGALPLPAPVTLFDLPVPGDGRRQLLLAREVPPTREGRTAYRLREIEFVGEAVMPMPVEIELDVSGPIPDRDDVLPAAARRVVDPLGAGRAIRRMLPGAERLSPFEQQEAMTSYAGLLMLLLVEMDSPEAEIVRHGDDLVVSAWSPAHG